MIQRRAGLELVTKEGAIQDPIWQTEGAEKRSAVQRMFADIAPTYDRLNGIMSFSLHRRWRVYAVTRLNLRERDRALDVCCGTGDFMIPLRKAVGPEGTVYGVDFCQPMLDVARTKNVGDLALGDACNLPLATEAFHAVSVGWGIRNVPDIDAAHRELFRVLLPGGRFVSLDMARPNSPLLRPFAEFVFNKLVPLLGSLFGKTDAYTYLPKSTQQFKTRQELKTSMELAGFVDVAWKDLFMGNICVHWGQKL